MKVLLTGANQLHQLREIEFIAKAPDTSGGGGVKFNFLMLAVIYNYPLSEHPHPPFKNFV